MAPVGTTGFHQEPPENKGEIQVSILSINGVMSPSLMLLETDHQQSKCFAFQIAMRPT